MLAVIGVGMFLLIGAINGPLVVNSAYTTPQSDPVSSTVHVDWHTRAYEELDDGNYTTPDAWYRLEQGTLDNYEGSAGQVYNFHVIYYSNDTAIPKISFGYARGIWGVQDSPVMVESDPTDINYIDGKEYYYTMTVAEAGIYSHWFAAVFGTGNEVNSLNTTVALGPLVGSQTDNWGTYIPIGAASMFCNIGLLFLIIVLLYWWLGTAKAKRRTWDDALREKEAEADDKTMDDALDSKPFTCDQCGAPVGVDDNFCPKCGERFDEDEENTATEKSPGHGKTPVEKEDS